MSARTVTFVGTPPAPPSVRPVARRSADFNEIQVAFAEQPASDQAGRCAQCGVPFCQYHCPLQNNIPDWLRLSAEGRLEEAYELAAATNSMPEICGRICPQDRLCEGACVIEQSGHGAVTIGAVEKHITETAWARGWVRPLAPRRERDESIGVIGAGPAGLAGAERLRGMGYQVVVYDRHDRAGGLLTYGIPNFKLEKHVVERRIQRLKDGGIQFVLSCEIGKDISFAELRTRHDAVLVAVGAYQARPLAVPNSAAAVPALSYLIAANRAGFGDALPERFDAKGRRVVVIGGGDTAMDCVRTAVRQGASAVTCLYRRDRANMPGSRREVAYAEEEGVVFDWLASPNALHAAGVKAARMRLGAADASGRSAPEETPDSAYDLDADLVIAALGFDPEDIHRDWGAEIETAPGGVIAVNQRFETSIEGVFAAGDIVRGASLVVWAIREGRDAADGVHAYLRERAALAKAAAQ
jgi:glutamate synthase (NADPH) small chain